MPGTVIELTVLIYSMAQIFGVQISLTWMITGVIVSSVLAIAAPPLPGGVALVVGILFAQMGIPSEAIAFAVACDVFYDFLDSAVTNSVGILECAMQADKFGMLDHDVLKSKDGVSFGANN